MATQVAHGEDGCGEDFMQELEADLENLIDDMDMGEEENNDVVARATDVSARVGVLPTRANRVV